jgi:hypothetical protein
LELSRISVRWLRLEQHSKSLKFISSTIANS